MERIRVNIIPKGITPVCHASQYDTGRVIRFDIMDELQPFVLSGTETIEFRVCKPDGNIVTAAVENTSSSYVDIVTTQQMTACEGINKCTLNIVDENDYDIATINIDMKVQVDVLKDGIESDTEIHNLTEQVVSIVSEQYDSDNVIFDNEPVEGHAAPYTVTSQGIKAALDSVAATIPDELNDLSDVNISSPSSNQALVWDAENNRWTNGEVSTVGNLDDLSDVDTTGKATGDSLRYDGNSWVAKPTTIALTQAEYDALQTKEPNTHYVITDAQNLNPTASDIEYSSGVSVKQAIDSKQATLSNQAVTITSNTLVLSGFTGACYQYGKVVCLFVQTANPSSEVAYESIFLTGLPKPVYSSGNNRVSLIDRATNKPYRFRITDSGQLQEWYNSSGKIPSGADLYGTIVYLAE